MYLAHYVDVYPGVFLVFPGLSAPRSPGNLLETQFFCTTLDLLDQKRGDGGPTMCLISPLGDYGHTKFQATKLNQQSSKVK